MEEQQVMMLNYRARINGGQGHPHFVEKWRGPTLYLYKPTTDQLFRKIGADHINGRTKVEIVRDKTLRELILNPDRVRENRPYQGALDHSL